MTNNVPTYEYTTFCLFIHSLVDGHFGCFHFWAFINSVTNGTGGVAQVVECLHWEFKTLSSNSSPTVGRNNVLMNVSV
jgi:hypothetical protein